MKVRQVARRMRRLVEDWNFNRSIFLGGGAVSGLHPGVPPKFAGAIPEAPLFPFRTATAERVFARARDMILEYPSDGPDAILHRALEHEPRPYYDLTPEDMQLLKMAIEWLQNGPPPPSARTGGAPGGPARFTGPNTSPPQSEVVDLRTKADLLNEFMAHPVAVGPNGIFSGGHAMPYPGIGNVAFGRHPPPWDYHVDPNALVADLLRRRKLEREKEKRPSKWHKLRKALGFPVNPTSP